MTIASKSKKIYSILNLAFKVIVSLLSIGYVCYVIFYQKREFKVENSNEVIDLNIRYIVNYVAIQFQQNSNNFLILSSVILLVFVNWGAEVLKWKIMISKMLPVNYKIATISILSGIAASLFTPFRIGGYFGRIAHLPFQYRTKGIGLILMGDAAQFIITIFCGTLSLMILLVNSPDGFNISEQKALLIPIAISSLIFSTSCIIVFLNAQKFILKLQKINFLKSWKKLWEILNKIKHQDAAKKLLLISFIRISGITIQYVLIFKLFGLEFSTIDSILIVNSLFFIYNFFPNFNIVEFGITKSAILLFLIQTFVIEGTISLNTALVVSCSSFIIWLINLVIPSLIGSYFLLKIKLLNDKQ